VERRHLRRIVITVLAVVGVFTAGTIGFHHLLHERWHSAFYRAVVTATLTGLDTTPRGPGAQFLTIALALSGVAIFGYVAAQAVEAVAREVTGQARREKRRRRMIGELRDHFIICGFGRVGRRAAEEFTASGQPFVVLDFNQDALAAARERDVLTIVARASDAEAERKLELAGADRVVQPYSTAGTEMAKLALKPQVAAFLEIVSSHAGPDLRFEEIEVTPESNQGGPSIRELRIRSTTGAVIVALRKLDGHFDTTPNPDIRIEVGDVLIAIGTEPELRALEDLFGPREAVAG